MKRLTIISIVLFIGLSLFSNKIDKQVIVYENQPLVKSINKTSTHRYKVTLKQYAKVVYKNDNSYLKLLRNNINKKQSLILVRGKNNVSLSDVYNASYDNFTIKNIAFGTTQYKAKGDKKKYNYQVIKINYYNINNKTMTIMKNKINKESNTIIKSIPKNYSKKDKIQYIHDTLIKRVSYDHTTVKAHSNDLYGALINKQAICSGYALTYTYLLKKININSSIVVSNDHAWTLLDHKYIDVTWNDIDQKDRNNKEYISHDYYGMTYNEIKKLPHHQIMGSIYSNKNINLLFNYFSNTQSYCNNYTYDNVKTILNKQYKQGNNLLEIQFSSNAYKQAIDNLPNDIYPIMNELGYKDVLAISRRNDRNIYQIYLLI